MRIQAVTLDVGGTLIEPWPSVGWVYAAVARDFGCPAIDAERLTAAFGNAWSARSARRVRRPFDYSRAAWRELVDLSFADAGGIRVSDACFDAIYTRFGEAEAWRVHDDVRPLLDGLRDRGIPVGLVSNWDERLRPLLERLGLLSEVRTLVVSHEVGHGKPAPEIFAEAAARFGVPQDRMLHVGDSVSEDFDGARRAGLQALWLCRSGGSGPGRVCSLSEVLARMVA